MKPRKRKNQQKRRAKTKRVARRPEQKTWHPSNYLLESNVELGLPECYEETRAYAPPV